jgi:pyridinium-3,5-biscarboxylic acid mononucleotide synthase
MHLDNPGGRGRDLLGALLLGLRVHKTTEIDYPVERLNLDICAFCKRILDLARDPDLALWHSGRVTTAEAINLLERFRAGKISRDKVLQAFQSPRVADMGFAKVDTHRALRKGFPEVIFGAGKTPPQVVQIAAKLFETEHRVLITRATPEHARVVRKKFKLAVYNEAARCITIERKPLPKRPGTIAVVCAGTSDLPVAEEAAVTADIMGNRIERVADVGVAGVHRLFDALPRIQSANVVVVVAGMEGALPSVVAGLVSKPVIAVPTSVGYGAHFGGLAPLLGMLNSCGSGVTVVNIDNGFGAGYAASQINALIPEREP